MARTSSRDAARRGNAAAEQRRVGTSLFPDIGETPDAADRAGPDDLEDRGRQGAVGRRPRCRGAGTAVFDDVRTNWSGIGLALYAFEPGGEVTLEIHSEGQVYSFNAPTAEAAFAIAFPPAAARQRLSDDGVLQRERSVRGGVAARADRGGRHRTRHVDERDIRDVRPDDLRGFTQLHFFAGIGVWTYALRRAGWPDDRPVWTGSLPVPAFQRGRQKRRGC